MNHLVNFSVGSAALIGLLGYLVVFFGLILLMLVVLALGKIMTRQSKEKSDGEIPTEAVKQDSLSQPCAAESSVAGAVELFGTNPRDAAVVMAIVAHQLGKPLNELRFISIKEVRE